jgi:hypothetical protein
MKGCPSSEYTRIRRTKVLSLPKSQARGSLEPEKNPIIVVLCGETNPALLTRLKQRYVTPLSGELIFIPFEIIEKPVGKKTS